ncbi:hypothetical protein, partial [Streptomyces sp. NPDC023327]|uniref:hypothetical protein n=1 Tax=Streptomyces sp. NPDC023327 TaxID=3157088 RepID=UPI003402E614
MVPPIATALAIDADTGTGSASAFEAHCTSASASGVNRIARRRPGTGDGSSSVALAPDGGPAYGTSPGPLADLTRGAGPVRDARTRNVPRAPRIPQDRCRAPRPVRRRLELIDLRRFFEDDVRVGARDPERGHPRPTRPALHPLP